MNRVSYYILQLTFFFFFRVDGPESLYCLLLFFFLGSFFLNFELKEEHLQRKSPLILSSPAGS